MSRHADGSVWCYAAATECPVLTQRMVLCSYYGMPGTDAVYGGTRDVLQPIANYELPKEISDDNFGHQVGSVWQFR
eukprot:451222-Rhodomonas_salina.1